MSAPPLPASDDEILARFTEERLGRLASMFGRDALAWLALPPKWTEPAASAAGFPSHVTPLQQFLEVASTSGLVDRDPPLRADPECGRAFWISDKDREPVLDFLRRHPSFGESHLREMTVRIAERLQAAQASVPLPDELRYWSDLARRAEAPFAAARQLGDEVAALTRSRNTGEALARVDAGRSLARVLGSSPLDAAIGVGNRRIGLAYRRAADDRHLKRYFHRPEQEHAFEALLDPRSPAWALHYLGVGGAGKTMLMRWITTPQDARARAVRERVVSRIDFDELSPEYPVRKPGQLLLDLAVELRSFGQSSHEEKLFDQINATVQELHETLGAAPPPSNPLANVQRPEFDSLLRGFCDLVRVLPPPVVLVLDTCEELARVPVTNGILPSIEATFSILERVHAEVDSVRVVFAGRRPIASSGHEWELRGSSEADIDGSRQRGFREFLRPRPYLALHEVRGVTRDEGRRFLETRLGGRAGRTLEDAIFDRSHDPGRAAEIVQTMEGAARDAGAERFSLFDLALYGDWVRDDPGVDAQTIAEGTSDPYVDLRIVQRVRQPAVRAALPAIAALGRFDAPMLRGAFAESMDDEAYAGIFREVGDYEWLDLQRESGSGSFFLVVDRNLLPRIRSYFAQPARQAEAAQVMARVAPGVASFIRRTRLGELSVSHLSAALAVLPPAGAARLWTEVLLRVRTQADLSWLRTVIERLMGVEFEAARHGPLERGLDLAAASVALLSGSMRSGSEAHAEWPDEATAGWVARCKAAIAIAQDAEGEPDGRAIAAWTRRLDAFAFVRTAGDHAEGPEPVAADVLARRMSEEEAAAIVGALESLAGALPSATTTRERIDGTDALARATGRWARTLGEHDYPAPIVGMAEMLAAKLSALAWDTKAAAEWCAAALETAARSEDEPSGLWLFWRAPALAADRIRHELLLLHEDVAFPSFPDPAAWLIGALSRNASIDGERLASAIERHRLDRDLPETGELGASEDSDRYVVERVPVTGAHRRTPRLFISLAMKRAALGDFEEADRRLLARARTAETSQADPETVWSATLARVDVACLSREVPRDLPSAVARLGREAKARASVTGVFALQSLTGADVTTDFVGTPHDTWRASCFVADVSLVGVSGRVDVDERVQRMREERRAREQEGASLPLSLALDVVEASRVASRHGLAVETGRTAQAEVSGVDELVRGMLRLYALDPIPDDELAAGIRVAPPLRALLPFSLRFSAPPGMQQLALVPAERAHMVDLVRQIESLAARGWWSESGQAGSNAPSQRERQALHLVEHVGLRRWMALAQEEGEMLALRLPAEGARLLELAALLASPARDRQGALAATTTASLARTRAGTREGSAPWRDALQAAWDDAAGDGSWRAIEIAAGEIAGRPVSVTDAVQASGLPSRGGWVARAVLAAVAHATQDEPDAWRRARDLYLSRYHDQRLAPELALVLDTATVRGRPSSSPAMKTSATSSTPLQTGAIAGFLLSLILLWIYLVRSNAFGPTGTPGLSSTRLLWPAIGAAIAMGALVLATAGRDAWALVAGLTIIFGGLCASYWIIGSVADVLIPDTLVPGPLGQSWRVGIMLAIAAGLGALQPGVRRLRALAARGSEASVWMSPASAPDDLRAQVAATTTFGLQLSCMRRTVGFPLFLLQDLPPWSGTVSIQGLRPYAETAATIEPDVLRPLGAIRSELRSFVWPVALRTGAASHAPWEGVLGLALAPGVDGARSAGEPVFFYRWGAPRPGRGREAWTDGPVQVLGTSQPDPWGPRTQPRPPVELAEASALATEPRATVVHAVGTPVVTSYGPRLRLAEGYSPAESNEPSSMTKVGYGRGSLGFLDPSMLPKDLPLLVLQQQPADSQARVASDREQAALLRAVAADLFEGGCDAVIVVPSLPPELAALVMRRIADGLSVGLPGWRAAVSRWVWRRRDLDRHRGQRALRELAAIVRSARDLVFEWDGFEAAAERIAHGNAETPPELPARERWADRELAWDFCLYARPGVSGSGDAHAEGPLE